MRAPPPAPLYAPYLIDIYYFYNLEAWLHTNPIWLKPDLATGQQSKPRSGFNQTDPN